MLAKPNYIGLLLINGGTSGHIKLHPNQRWIANFSRDNEVVINRNGVYLYLDKDFFNDKFVVLE